MSGWTWLAGRLKVKDPRKSGSPAGWKQEGEYTNALLEHAHEVIWRNR